MSPTPRLFNEACMSFDTAHGFLLLFSRVLFFYAYRSSSIAVLLLAPFMLYIPHSFFNNLAQPVRNVIL